MKQFTDNNLIDEQTFSLYMDGANSYIDFGTPDTNVINGQSPVYIPLGENDGKWSSYVKGMYWDTDRDSRYYNFGEQRAFLSTGSSCIAGPYNEIGWMNAKLNSLLSTCTSTTNYGQVFPCA